MSEANTNPTPEPTKPLDQLMRQREFTLVKDTNDGGVELFWCHIDKVFVMASTADEAIVRALHLVNSLQENIPMSETTKPLDLERIRWWPERALAQVAKGNHGYIKHVDVAAALEQIVALCNEVERLQSLCDAAAEGEKLREQLRECQLDLQLTQLDQEDLRRQVEALDGEPGEADLWSELKKQRDDARDQLAAATKAREEAEAACAAMREAASLVLSDIQELVACSRGVDGLHLNGDVAAWESLLKGGEYEQWLQSLESLSEALAPSAGAALLARHAAELAAAQAALAEERERSAALAKELELARLHNHGEGLPYRELDAKDWSEQCDS